MNPICPYCEDGLLEMVGLPEDRAGRCDSCERLHLEGAVRMDFELAKPKWHAGARTDEVLAFRLAPGYEAGVRMLPDDELAASIALAAARGRNDATRTPWLTRYGRLLLTETRRRRGVA